MQATAGKKQASRAKETVLLTFNDYDREKKRVS